MKYAIIWTWLQPRDSVQDVGDANPLEPKQRVGYFTTLSEAMATFDEPSFGEKELVAILETRGDCANFEGEDQHAFYQEEEAWLPTEFKA